ncbi:MAG: hypothetical protein ABIR96_03120 [Bdellovibrionota bacterium]
MSQADNELPLDGIHPLIYEGDNKLKAYELTVKGGEPVGDFLDDRKRVSEVEHDGIFAVLKMLDVDRTFRNGQKFKKLEDYNGKALLELKKNQVRVGCFWAEGHRDTLLLAYGCIKKGDDWKKGDLQQFRNRYDAYTELPSTIAIKDGVKSEENKSKKKR